MLIGAVPNIARIVPSQAALDGTSRPSSQTIGSIAIGVTVESVATARALPSFRAAMREAIPNVIPIRAAPTPNPRRPIHQVSCPDTNANEAQHKKKRRPCAVMRAALAARWADTTCLEIGTIEWYTYSRLERRNDRWLSG